MDRRQARREILRQMGLLEETRDKLEIITDKIDAVGDPILAGQLRGYVEKLTDTLDKMYVWAGNI